MSGAPLLSVCVPTYQRAGLLLVMLQALLPQAAALGPDVEVCISDNASTDDTEAVVRAALAAEPGAAVKYRRHAVNLGPVRNYVLCATQQATGEFVWALGDDDLLVPGALQRVCDALRAHRDVEFFYANFAAAQFQEHWPVEAVGGYRGLITSLACPFLHDRPVRHWQDLLDSSSSMGTQVYAHIVARTVWTRYWHERPIAPDYHSLESTYPHSCMLIDRAWDKPAYYLGTPHLVQFDGRPGWGDGNGSRITLVSLPQLIARLDERGLGLHALIRARAYLKATVLDGYRSVIAGRGGADAAEIVALSLALGERFPEMIEAMVTAIGETDGHVVPGVIDAVREGLSNAEERARPRYVTGSAA